MIVERVKKREEGSGLVLLASAIDLSLELFLALITKAVLARSPTFLLTTTTTMASSANRYNDDHEHNATMCQAFEW
jgi:hypothetical protein